MIFHLLFKACCRIEVFNVCDEIFMVNLITALTILTSGSMLFSVTHLLFLQLQINLKQNILLDLTCCTFLA
jgi:hypothetical protein